MTSSAIVSICCIWNQSNKSPTFSSFLSRDGLEAWYHYTLTCEDANSQTRPLFKQAHNNRGPLQGARTELEHIFVVNFIILFKMTMIFHFSGKFQSLKFLQDLPRVKMTPVSKKRTSLILKRIFTQHVPILHISLHMNIMIE